jgi:HEAT repeat protein
MGAAGLGFVLLAALWAARRAGADAQPGRISAAHQMSSATRFGEVGADKPLTEILSGIDYAPSRDALDDVMGDAASDQLVAIARGAEADLDDAGLRIRAYRALALYAAPETETALRAAVAEHGAVDRGVDTLYVRAAMDSLAVVAPGRAVPALAPMLAHPSQDVRAGAARALGATGSDDAISHLRARLQEEPVLQVRLAIADALRRVDNASEGTVTSPEILPAP